MIALAGLILPHAWMSDTLVRGDQMGRAPAMWDLRPYPPNSGIPVRTDERSAGQIQTRIRVDLTQRDRFQQLVLIQGDPASRIFLNSIRLSPVAASTAPPEAIAFPVTPAFWNAGENALDIVAPSGTWRLRPALLAAIGSNSDLSGVHRYLAADRLVRGAIAVLGVVGALGCLASLSFAPRQLAGLWRPAVLMLALAVVAQPDLVPGTDRLSGSDQAIAVLIVCGLGGLAVLAAIIGPDGLAAGWRRTRLQDWLPLIAFGFMGGALAAIRGAPSFETWPAALLALGLAAALVELLRTNLILAVAAGRWFVASLQRYRHRESLIRHQEETISQQAETLESEIRRRAVLEERQRFSRDIHDGLGGSLLSLLVEVRSGAVDANRIADSLEANLDELRMMIDSLDHSETSLSAALSTFQTRLRHLLTHAGISLRWSQPDDLGPTSASPDFILHLYRILQEAAANIVRHSGASEAMFDIRWVPDGPSLAVDIVDNGSPQSAGDSAGNGNGLSNMATRVDQMRGQFEAGRINGAGWKVSFTLPVSVDAPPR